MTRFRLFALCISLLGLMGLLGCSEGEVIPLVPSGPSCERPLDQGWSYHGNICDSKRPRDAVWPAEQMPVVVGGAGLILQCDANSQWQVVDLGIQENLNVVAANADGDLMAAGENGVLAFRQDGEWQTMEPLADTPWRDARSNGSQVWLAGENGQLAKGQPGSAWEMVAVPDSTHLYSVCAFADSVFTGGSNGLLRVLVNGQWEDVSSPLWEAWFVQSIVRLDDGRLAVWAGGLWIRELDGWREMTEIQYYALNDHMKVHDGYLWLMYGYNEYYRLDLSVDPVEVVPYQGLSNPQCLAPGPDNQAFAAGWYGTLSWTSLDDQNNVISSLDPAGLVEVDQLQRLDDGTVVGATEGSLFRATASGLESIDFLSSEVREHLTSYSLIHGATLDDFYLATEWNLYRVQNGNITFATEIPTEDGRPRKLLVSREGEVCLAMRDIGYFWTGSIWRVWKEDLYVRAFLTQEQNFIAVLQTRAEYISPSGVFSIPLGMRAAVAWEPEPGVLKFMNSDFILAQWQDGVPMGEHIYMVPMPGCSDVYPQAIVETTSGILVVTSNHSMVLRVPDDPHLVDWELVAGPCLNEISDVQVLEDGHLVALGNGGDNIMIYSPFGY